MATTSHVELFHQMKNELLRDHEAAIGRTVDHQAWEKVSYSISLKITISFLRPWKITIT